MGDAGWWIVIGIATLFDPVILGLGVFVGLLVRRWSEIIVGVVAVPLGYWSIHYLRNPSEPFASHLDLLPLVAVVGLVWSALAFAGKKSMRE